MTDYALAICYTGLGLAAALGILLWIEPARFRAWLFPPAVEVPEPDAGARS